MLAIAAAAIAFTIKLTDGDELHYSQIPLGIAVLLWVYSFYSGIKHVESAELAVANNVSQLKHLEEAEINKTLPSLAILHELGERLESHSRKGARHRKHQRYSLMWGGIFFFAYHLADMAIRTICDK